ASMRPRSRDISVRSRSGKKLWGRSIRPSPGASAAWQSSTRPRARTRRPSRDTGARSRSSRRRWDPSTPTWRRSSTAWPGSTKLRGSTCKPSRGIGVRSSSSRKRWDRSTPTWPRSWRTLRPFCARRIEPRLHKTWRRARESSGRSAPRSLRRSEDRVVEVPERANTGRPSEGHEAELEDAVDKPEGSQEQDRHRTHPDQPPLASFPYLLVGRPPDQREHGQHDEQNRDLAQLHAKIEGHDGHRDGLKILEPLAQHARE